MNTRITTQGATPARRRAAVASVCAIVMAGTFLPSVAATAAETDGVIRGVLAVGGGGERSAATTITATPVSGKGESVSTTVTGRSFALEVPAGDYRVSVTGDGLAQTWFPGVNDVKSAETIEVLPGDIAGVRLESHASSRLDALIVGVKDLSKATVTLYTEDGTELAVNDAGDRSADRQDWASFRASDLGDDTLYTPVDRGIYGGYKLKLSIPGEADSWCDPRKERATQETAAPTIIEDGHDGFAVCQLLKEGVKNTAAPTLKNRPTAAKVGQTLTLASHGKWTHQADKYTYQWYRNGKAIDDKDATHKVTSADKGAKLTLEVRDKKAGYFTAAAKTKTVKVKK